MGIRVVAPLWPPCNIVPGYIWPVAHTTQEIVDTGRYTQIKLQIPLVLICNGNKHQIGHFIVRKNICNVSISVNTENPFNFVYYILQGKDDQHIFSQLSLQSIQIILYVHRERHNLYWTPEQYLFQESSITFSGMETKKKWRGKQIKNYQPLLFNNYYIFTICDKSVKINKLCRLS